MTIVNMVREPDDFRQAGPDVWDSKSLLACMCNIQGKIVWSSEGFQRFAELLQTGTSSLICLFTPESIDDVFYQFYLSTGGKSYCFISNFADRKGRRLELFTYAFPVVLDYGRPGFGSVMFPVVSKEFDSPQQDQFFKYIAEVKPNPIAITNPDGVLLWANTAYHQKTSGNTPLTEGRLAPHFQAIEHELKNKNDLPLSATERKFVRPLTNNASDPLCSTQISVSRVWSGENQIYVHVLNSRLTMDTSG